MLYAVFCREQHWLRDYAIEAEEIDQGESVVPFLEYAMNVTMNTRSLELQNLIAERKTVIETFFLAMYPSRFSDVASTPYAEQIWEHTAFAQLLAAVQERFFRVEPQDTQETHSDTQHVALLLHELSVLTNARRMVVKRCWHHGHFDPVSYQAAHVDRIVPTATKPMRPEPHEVFPKIRAIIARIEAKYAAHLANLDSNRDYVLVREVLGKTAFLHGGYKKAAPAGSIQRTQRSSLTILSW